MVVEAGVEPANGRSRIDLQSTPFGHLDTPPSNERGVKVGGAARVCQEVFFGIPASDDSRLPEAVEAHAAGVGGGSAEDDVIDQLDVDGARGVAELARDLSVGGARRRVAAGVIVLCGVPSYVQ